MTLERRVAVLEADVKALRRVLGGWNPQTVLQEYKAEIEAIYAKTGK